jgi:hypothetical protein
MFEEDDDSCQVNKSYLKVDIEGVDPQLWAKLKSRLTEMVIELLNYNINSKTDGNVKEEFSRITANVLEFANAKLEKASIENQKLLVEIQNILANRGKELAEARKLNAEADEIELKNIITRFKFAIGAAKVLASSSNDAKLLLFTKNFEELLYIFQENKADSKLLE